MTAPYSTTRTFEVPEYLKREDIGVTEISLYQRSMVFKYKVNQDMKGDIKILITGTWDTDVTQLRNKAFKKGFMDKNIDLLVKGFGHIYSGEAADTISEIKHGVAKEIEAAKINQAIEVDDDKKPKVIKYFVQKYHNASEGNELYEAVLVGKDAFFVSLDRDSTIDTPHCRLINAFSIPNAIGNTVIEILPRENLTYLSKPYQFESEKEINQYLEKASKENLDSIYLKVKQIVQKYIAAASDTHHVILAADVVFSYFMDVFGQTHYLFFYGDNGTGKTINLLLISQIGYRVMYDIDVTAANIFTYYGTIEEGQGVICEDEADDLDYHQQEKMKIYKKGYNAGGKVTRTETGGDSGRKQDGYYVYGFKAFTGEERLDPDYAKGFNERTFYLECQEGDPDYDLSEVISPAGAEEFEYLLSELEDTYKTLLAFRLLRHTDKFPNIDVAVKNREKQLVKPLVRLFQGTQSLKEISEALGKLIAERRGVKKDTIEFAVYEALENRIIEQDNADKTKAELERKEYVQRTAYEFAAKAIYTDVKDKLDGHYKDEDKDQSFETPMHGKVSHKKISIICEDRFGAKRKHTKSGNMLTFEKVRFERVKERYSVEGEGVQIVKAVPLVKDVKDVKDSSSVGGLSGEKMTTDENENRTKTDENGEEFEEEEEEFEESDGGGE
jgi:hypothetical protein